MAKECWNLTKDVNKSIDKAKIVWYNVDVKNLMKIRLIFNTTRIGGKNFYEITWYRQKG